MTTQSLWVLLCGLRVALLACESGHWESSLLALCAGESGVGNQWKIWSPGSCSCLWFPVATPGNIPSVCKAKCSSAGVGGGFRCSPTAPLCKQSPDSPQ